MTLYMYERVSRREQIKATIFAFFLVAAIVGSLVFSIAASGPIVLGTEMNTNGFVEYLCLGKGCEQLP